MKDYWVYILGNPTGNFYTGVTNNLERRVFEHKQGIASKFTAKYHIHQLLYFETCSDITAAIAREKQIKGWKRIKKIALIETINRNWLDLSADWYKRAKTF